MPFRVTIAAAVALFVSACQGREPRTIHLDGLSEVAESDCIAAIDFVNDALGNEVFRVTGPGADIRVIRRSVAGRNGQIDREGSGYRVRLDPIAEGQIGTCAHEILHAAFDHSPLGFWYHNTETGHLMSAERSGLVISRREIAVLREVYGVGAAPPRPVTVERER